jgi:hypothetical protein
MLDEFLVNLDRVLEWELARSVDSSAIIRRRGVNECISDFCARRSRRLLSRILASYRLPRIRSPARDCSASAGADGGEREKWEAIGGARARVTRVLMQLLIGIVGQPVRRLLRKYAPLVDPPARRKERGREMGLGNVPVASGASPRVPAHFSQDVASDDTWPSLNSSCDCRRKHSAELS